MSDTLTLPSPATTGETVTSCPLLVLHPTPDAIERLLAFARTHLGMEVAIVSEFTGRRQVPRYLEGNPEEFGLEIGAVRDLSETYCWRVANGRLPQVIPDAKSDVRLRDLPVTWAADIASYIGVPLRFSDGRIYGSVCCLSHSANPSLRERDAEFMTMLASLIGQELEAEWAAHRERIDAVGRIRGILERGGLRAVFQPIFDLGSLSIVAYEALTVFEAEGSSKRWFAEAAEIGLGPDLERAAMQVAMAHLGDLPRHALLEVNLSLASMRSSTILDMIAAVLGDRIIVGLAPGKPDDAAGLEEVVRDLRARGFRLAVDHMSSESADLADICRLQPDVLRLDADAIRGIETDRLRRDVISFLVRFGSELGAVIVAGGIETRPALGVLRDLGVPYGKGFALAPPLTPEDLAHGRP